MILVVDDEKDIAEVIQIQLELEGFDCLVAYDGVEASEVLEKNNLIRIIISDVMMPRMDGRGLIQKVNSDYPQIDKFFFVSGYSNMKPDEVRSLGATALLGKPVDIDDLIVLLNA